MIDRRMRITTYATSRALRLFSLPKLVCDGRCRSHGGYFICRHYLTGFRKLDHPNAAAGSCRSMSP